MKLTKSSAQFTLGVIFITCLTGVEGLCGLQGEEATENNQYPRQPLVFTFLKCNTCMLVKKNPSQRASNNRNWGTAEQRQNNSLQLNIYFLTKSRCRHVLDAHRQVVYKYSHFAVIPKPLTNGVTFAWL